MNPAKIIVATSNFINSIIALITFTSLFIVAFTKTAKLSRFQEISITDFISNIKFNFICTGKLKVKVLLV